MTLELTVLGCEGSGPSREGPASGYLVTADDVAVWVDAGTGTFMALAGLMDPADLGAAVISHMHPDHSADSLGLIQYLAHRVGASRPIPTFLPYGAPERLEGFFGSGSDNPRFDVLAMEEVGDGDSRQIDGLTLRFATTNHSVPTIAVRIEHDEAAIAYSADTGLGGGFPDLAAGADVLLCEAGLRGVRGEAVYPYHLDATEAGELATRAGADRLILTHLAPTLPPQQALQSARTVFGGRIDIAEPGLRIRV